MQQGPLRTLPIAPESKHFKRKVCITEKKKSGHLQPSTNWGFVAVALIFSNWLQGQLTSRVLSAMIISSWLWWENLAVSISWAYSLAQRTASRLTGEKARDGSLPATSSWAALGRRLDSGHLFLRSSNRGSGRIYVTKLLWGLREILPTKSSVQWVIHTERSVNVSQGWPHTWQMVPLLGERTWRQHCPWRPVPLCSWGAVRSPEPCRLREVCPSHTQDEQVEKWWAQLRGAGSAPSLDVERRSRSST